MARKLRTQSTSGWLSWVQTLLLSASAQAFLRCRKTKSPQPWPPRSERTMRWKLPKPHNPSQTCSSTEGQNTRATTVKLNDGSCQDPHKPLALSHAEDHNFSDFPTDPCRTQI